MGQSSSKHEEYKEYYTNNNINDIDLTTLDPYKILGVSKKFTWNELKTAYRNAALKTHPDKQGGNKLVFDFITNCFKDLATEYKNREENKSHQELKSQSKEYFNKFVDTNVEHPSSVLKNANEPFDKRFNKAFEDCKFYDEEREFGYGSLMSESSANRDDIDIENIFKKDKIDNSTFNEIFNKKVPCSKEIVKYKEPEALMMAKQLNYTEIGASRPEDYSSGVEKQSLGYTDYMKAYSGTRLINPDGVKIKSYKNVDEYEKYRDTRIKKGLSDREKSVIEKRKELEERKEFERIERIKKQDIAIQQAHEKANKMLIK